jgi:hypothetical protein
LYQGYAGNGCFEFARLKGWRAAEGREFQFADQDSTRSDRSKVMVRREGQQYLESCHSDLAAAGAWITAMAHKP